MNTYKTVEEIVGEFAKEHMGHRIQAVELENPNYYGIVKGLRELLSTAITEAEERGKQNPNVNFLRQFLNESPNWKGEMLTNEDLLRFIRISTEEK